MAPVEEDSHDKRKQRCQRIQHTGKGTVYPGLCFGEKEGRYGKADHAYDDERPDIIPTDHLDVLDGNGQHEYKTEEDPESSYLCVTIGFQSPFHKDEGSPPDQRKEQ